METVWALETLENSANLGEIIDLWNSATDILKTDVTLKILVLLSVLETLEALKIKGP